MPRGKKTSPQEVYKIMTSWMVTNNYSETARNLDVPPSTVKDVVEKHKNEPKFAKLRDEKMDEFATKAAEIIQKGMTLLNKRLDRAIASEDDLDVLIDEIFATDKEELTQEEKRSLVTKLRALQLQDIKAITTAIGTLYDKRALAIGDSTEHVTVEVKVPEGFEDYAG